MPSNDQTPRNVPSQMNTQAESQSASRPASVHPHALYIAGLLLSAYQEFLEIHRTIDAPSNLRYNDDKNICSGDENGKLG